jgi:hypothetical protein
LNGKFIRSLFFFNFPRFSSFLKMSSTNHGDASSNNSAAVSPVVEPKRKVSILTDPPHQQQLGAYDNPAFDGPRRKISQVRFSLQFK